MKTYEFEITKNPLKDRNDVVKSLVQMLEPCMDKFVMGNTGLFNYNGSTTYCDRVGLFEGWSRLLWGIGPLLAGGYKWSGLSVYKEGLSNGTDPSSPYYWGDVHDFDQRIVEMAAISLAVMLNKKELWDGYSKAEQDRIYKWLDMVNGRSFSENNWKFFRILVNLLFEQVGRPVNEERLENDLALIESFYIDDGWYRDAVPFDNYNPFAIQFYSMIYYYFRKDKDKERCKRYEERVKLFAKQHIHYLTEDGLFVPYGRSLTYRFAVVSFYSACAFAGIEVLPWGVMKGIILRNLRWWFKQPIFDREGMLTVGYRYPDLTIADQYNSPGSPYWAFKTYLMLALPADHPFWTSKEEELPKLPDVKCLKVPRIIFSRTKEDVVLLNGGQYPEYQMNHAADKYAKFAYSAKFGFSCSISNYGFEKTGCDSMLYVGTGDGYWRQRRKCESVEMCEDYSKTVWKPYDDTEICTYLIPAGCFHIRIHIITSQRDLLTKEGGFGLARYKDFDLELPVNAKSKAKSDVSLIFPWGFSYIADPSNEREASYIMPAPNLNNMASCVLVPVLSGEIKKGKKNYHICVTGASPNTGYMDKIPAVHYDVTSGILTIDGKKLELK
ncbi:DUF2264 domain-containing protein [Treponema parvum]|uniref:DUF2264 domain-containing protein n=1 Tax=Treponema parvum TaxID=138851 RepID=A0A975F5X6_9SPIR|nr:DUF2264 domain-containing protein [Treponema parvum]QTQ14888.1 DUF2264 domain-containing protein [Treponema parvum]